MGDVVMVAGERCDGFVIVREISEWDMLKRRVSHGQNRGFG